VVKGPKIFALCVREIHCRHHHGLSISGNDAARNFDQILIALGGGMLERRYQYAGQGNDAEPRLVITLFLFLILIFKVLFLCVYYLGRLYDAGRVSAIEPVED
jgi:hypothetical protein